MEQDLDRSIEAWSDDQLLEEYRYLTADVSDNSEHDKPDLSAVIEELRRRALSHPDVPTELPKTDSVDWSGGGGGEDPGSGALPDPAK
jgi:hypothetical protein